MSGQIWGESFLKSGLPLEHLTLLTLRSIGWTCESTPSIAVRTARGS